MGNVFTCFLCCCNDEDENRVDSSDYCAIYCDSCNQTGYKVNGDRCECYHLWGDKSGK